MRCAQHACQLGAQIYGSDAIKEKWLPDLATNKVSRAQQDCATTAYSDARSAVFCLSEPNAGSDAFGLQTTAKLDKSGDFYVLNGSKCWISNSEQADTFLVSDSSTSTTAC